MTKKNIKFHQKGPATGLYQAARLPTGVKNFNSRPMRKAKKQAK